MSPASAQPVAYGYVMPVAAAYAASADSAEARGVVVSVSSSSPQVGEPQPQSARGGPSELDRAMHKSMASWLGCFALVLALVVVGKALDERNRPIESRGLWELGVCCAQPGVEGCAAEGWKGVDRPLGTLCPASGLATPSAQSIVLDRSDDELDPRRAYTLCGYMSAGFGLELEWRLTDEESGAVLVPRTTTRIEPTDESDPEVRRRLAQLSGAAAAAAAAAPSTGRRLLKGSSTSSGSGTGSGGIGSGGGGVSSGGRTGIFSSGSTGAGTSTSRASYAGYTAAAPTAYGSRSSFYTTSGLLYLSAGRSRTYNRAGNGTAATTDELLDFFVIKPPVFSLAALSRTSALRLALARLDLLPPVDADARALDTPPMVSVAICAAVDEQSRAVWSAGQGLWAAGLVIGCLLFLVAASALIGWSNRKSAGGGGSPRLAIAARVCFLGGALSALAGGITAASWGVNPQQGAGAGFIVLGLLLILAYALGRTGGSAGPMSDELAAAVGRECTPARVLLNGCAGLLLVALGVSGALLDTRGAVGWPLALILVVGCTLALAGLALFCDVRREHMNKARD